VGRTARAELTGDAFTFVAPDEEGDLRAIERAIGQGLPRVTIPGFDYSQVPQERLEIPLGERLAAHRNARRAAGAGKPKARPAAKAAASTGGPGARSTGAGAPRRPPRRDPREARFEAILDRIAPRSADGPPRKKTGRR
jgi:ATP-dependent RNA helicase RhlE